MVEADVLVELEAKLGRVDAQLPADLGVLDPCEQLEMVVRDGLGAGPVRDRLAEPRVERADPQDLEVDRDAEGVGDVPARHEPEPVLLHEGDGRDALADPGIAAGPAQGLASQSADHSRSKRSTGTTNTVAPPTSTSRG